MAELDFDDMYGSKYLGVPDLKDAESRCTIKNVEVEELKDKAGVSKHKYVVWFEEQTKGLVVNRTTEKNLADAWGKKSASGIGQRGTLYAEDTNFCRGVRVRSIKTQKQINE